MKPDPEYIKERNELIPSAEVRANVACGSMAPSDIHDREKWYHDWSLCFHQTMNRLWADRVKG